MNIFQSFLNSIPKNRSEYVNELEIPEITLEPYVWTDLDESLSVISDSVVPDSMEDDRGTLSTDTSLPLSRAMTDSEIDYEFSRRIRSRRFSDPWEQLKSTMDAFPSDYVSSLRRLDITYYEKRHTRNNFPSNIHSDHHLRGRRQRR